METIKLNNNVEMPMVGLGTYGIPYNETKKCVLYAIDCGYRLIDTAQYYGNENLIGNAITECTVNREELFIVTKIQSGKNIKKSIEDSLKNLKSDYIDLLLIHWPMGNDLEIYKIMEDYYEKEY